jgi:hypothetical protein
MYSLKMKDIYYHSKFSKHSHTDLQDKILAKYEFEPMLCNTYFHFIEKQLTGCISYANGVYGTKPSLKRELLGLGNLTLTLRDLIKDNSSALNLLPMTQ